MLDLRYVMGAPSEAVKVWHQAELKDGHPLKQALCGIRTFALSAEKADTWPIVWKRLAIAPPGAYCGKCDELAFRINRPVGTDPRVTELLASVFGIEGGEIL